MMAAARSSPPSPSGIKLIVVLVQNHGFASIGSLSESLGSQRFGTRYRYREADGNSTASMLPVDLAANAASLGRPGPDRRGPSRSCADALKRGQGGRRGPPSCTSRPTRSTPVPSSESWWDVPVAEVSASGQHAAARTDYEAAKRDQRAYL